MAHNEDLNSQMITDALVIISSVGFVEKELNKNFSLLEEAVRNSYAEDIPILEQRILGLMAKVRDENRNMDDFMAKYTTIIENEKKAILSGAQ